MTTKAIRAAMARFRVLLMRGSFLSVAPTHHSLKTSSSPRDAQGDCDGYGAGLVVGDRGPGTDGWHGRKLDC
jgi:hypothetical protein